MWHSFRGAYFCNSIWVPPIGLVPWGQKAWCECGGKVVEALWKTCGKLMENLWKSCEK